jgi:hypothetical protein
VANDSGVQPGWYADPLGRFELRYFNGDEWTADVSNDGGRFVDPLGIAIAPSDGPGASTPAANTVATSAMVLGIIAVATAWMPVIVAFGAVCAVFAVTLGFVGLRRARRTGVGRNRAIVGLVTGGSGLVAAVLGVVLTVIVVDVYDAYVNPAAHEVVITSCTVTGSRATAMGTITNLDDEAADFSILVGFVRPGTDNLDRQARTEVDGVAPGASAEFTVERQVTLEDVDCLVNQVNGPLPFGLALD